MTLSKLTARNTSGALHGSKPDESLTNSFTIGVNKPEQKRKNATGRRSPETHSLSGSKNSEQLPISIRFQKRMPMGGLALIDYSSQEYVNSVSKELSHSVEQTFKMLKEF